jgi:hypothetical protein
LKFGEDVRLVPYVFHENLSKSIRPCVLLCVLRGFYSGRTLIKEGAFDIWDLTDPNKKISFAGEMDYARHDGSFEHHEKLTPFISSYHHNFAQHGAIISDNASAEEVQTLLSAVEMERKRRGQG